MNRYEHHLTLAAARRPGHAAIVHAGGRTSYGELDAAASRFADGLVEHAAFANGERCVVFLDNRVETAVAIFGTLRAGGARSVINPTTKTDKLAFLLNNGEASVLVTQARLAALAFAAAPRAPTGRNAVVG